MNQRDKKLKRVPLQFILAFLVLAVGMVMAGGLYYRHQKENIRKAMADELSAVADLKVNQILSWREERLGDATIIYRTPFIARRIRAFLRNVEDPALKRDMAAWMGALQEYYQYAHVFLVDSEGRVKYSVPGTGEEMDPVMKSQARESMKTRKPLFTDIYLDADTGSVHLAVISPLPPGEKGRSSSPGAVVLHIDPSRFLFPLIQAWPTPSPSAETLLVKRVGNDVLYLNELRHRKGTALSLRFRSEEADLPAAMAARGIKGAVTGVDYRGAKVLAVIREIPGFPWFIVAKVDRQEIDGPLHERALLVAIIVALFVMASGIILYFLWRRHWAEAERRERGAVLRHLALLKRYELLTRHANDIILVTDRDGKIIDANERAVEFYGYGSDELRQLNVRDIRSPGARPFADSWLKDVNEKKGVLFETIHQRKDGAPCPVEVSSRFIEIEGEKFYQSIVRDISERKEAEERLAKYRDHLEEMVKERTAELEAFSYSVSHDLRAPLRSIDGFSQALMEDFHDVVGEEGKDCLTRIRVASQRMGHLIDDLLALSRISRVEMRAETVDLSAMAGAISEEMKNTEPRRQVNFVIAGGILVQGDPDLLRIAMENLLGNAFKFTRNTEEAVIEFGSVPGDGGSIYFIRDNGAGFDMAYGDKLFAPFQRLHSRSEFEGTGIGLATVQRVVRRHKGRVWPESDAGKGATFYFTIHSESQGRTNGKQDHTSG